MVAIVVLEATDAATYPQWENQSQIIIMDRSLFVHAVHGAQSYDATHECLCVFYWNPMHNDVLLLALEIRLHKH